MSGNSSDRMSSRPRRASDRLDSVWMGGPVISLPLRSQENVLLTRRRARDLAGLLQLGAEAQSRLATAVWEVARVAQRHGSESKVELAVSDDPPAAVVAISGIAHSALTGDTPGDAGDRLDLAKLRQLVDRVEARGHAETVLVRLTSELDDDAWVPGLEELAHVLGSLQRHESGEAEATVNELRMQNAELMSALATVRERGDELDSRLREDVHLIDGAMEDALDLLNDHIDLVRLAAGREVVRVGEVSVEELFSALRGIVAHLPRADEVAIVFDDLDGVPPLRTDAAKLSQILRNYVVNGLKYTARGELRVSAVALDDGAMVRFAVADTGPGLAPADQARVFDEFVQLDRAAQVGELRGAGLGLPICKRLATLLGGEVGVTSEPGRGSTFTATIPSRFTTNREDVEVIEG